MASNPSTNKLRQSKHLTRRSVTNARVIKYGARNFVRNAWLSVAATLVMTITLTIIFVTIIASMILTSTAESMREKIDITVFFKPGTSQIELEKMANTMQADENVKSVVASDSKAEYDKFVEENKEDENLMQTLADENMSKKMLEAMQATMRIKVKDIDDLDSVKNIVNTDLAFQASLDEKAPTYDDNRQEIETVTSWANLAKNGGIILGIVFLLISVLVIFNTIRMAIFSRREEIDMMKLIGADKAFVRGPFLMEASLYGVIAGIIASLLGYFGFKAIAPGLENYGVDISFIQFVLGSRWLAVVVFAMIVLGVLIGYISARLAVRKYLRY